MRLPDYTDNGIYTYSSGEYTVKPTGQKLVTAMTTMAHLHSKKFRGAGVEVPQGVIDELRERIELEKEAAKKNKKRKGQEQRVKKKIRLIEQYNMTHEGNGKLYTKLKKDDVLVYDCAACKKLVPDYAFVSHIAMDVHKDALRPAGYNEDEQFIEAEKDHVKEAIRQKSESVWCTPCEKWVSKYNYQAHCTGKSHRAKTRAVVEEAGRTTGDTTEFTPVEEPMFNVFCYKSDMWDMDATYEDVAVATVDGYKTVFFGEDSTEYGNMRNPACGFAMVKDGTASSLGVCYTVTDRVLEDLRTHIKYRSHDLVEIQVKIGEEEQHAYTFIPRNAVKWKASTVAGRLVKAVGPKGPAYALLAKLVHEHEKQEWADKYLIDVLQQAQKLIWGSPTV